LADEVDPQVRNGAIVISPSDRVRSWVAAARALADRCQDELLDSYVPTHLDDREWKRRWQWA